MIETIGCAIAWVIGIGIVMRLIAFSVDNVNKEWQREEQRKYDSLNQKTKKEDT